MYTKEREGEEEKIDSRGVSFAELSFFFVIFRVVINDVKEERGEESSASEYIGTKNGERANTHGGKALVRSRARRSGDKGAKRGEIERATS